MKDRGRRRQHSSWSSTVLMARVIKPWLWTSLALCTNQVSMLFEGLQGEKYVHSCADPRMIPFQWKIAEGYDPGLQMSCITAPSLRDDLIKQTNKHPRSDHITPPMLSNCIYNNIQIPYCGSYGLIPAPLSNFAYVFILIFSSWGQKPFLVSGCICNVENSTWHIL